VARKYELKERARRQDDTRQRITEAAVELHGTIGPARTTISAVAERAGVQRLTVYRHFPTEGDLLAACTGRWQQEHPAPDPGEWMGIADPEARARAALTALYGYYDPGEAMIANTIRDADEVKPLQAIIAGFGGYLGIVADDLARAFGARGRARKRGRAAAGHAVSFTTWRSLVREQGLTGRDAVELMVALLARTGAR
jgi:AcrR family transcriptional regulator